MRTFAEITLSPDTDHGGWRVQVVVYQDLDNPVTRRVVGVLSFWTETKWGGRWAAKRAIRDWRRNGNGTTREVVEL